MFVIIFVVKDQVNNNSQTARLRFQWWREVINNAYSDQPVQPRDHPVVQALHNSIKEIHFCRRWIDRILESREVDALRDRLETLSDLEMYAEQSHSSVLYLLLEILNIKNEKSDFAASHVGVCSGVVASLRGLPYLASKVRLRNIYLAMGY